MSETQQEQEQRLQLEEKEEKKQDDLEGAFEKAVKISESIDDDDVGLTNPPQNIITSAMEHQEQIQLAAERLKSCWTCKRGFGVAGAGNDLKRCKGCKQARYCSKVCQTVHWAYHEEDCKAWKSPIKTISKHIRSPEEAFLTDLCTTLSLILVTTSHVTIARMPQISQMFESLLKQEKNHPSCFIIGWTAENKECEEAFLNLVRNVKKALSKKTVLCHYYLPGNYNRLPTFDQISMLWPAIQRQVKAVPQAHSWIHFIKDDALLHQLHVSSWTEALSHCSHDWSVTAIHCGTHLRTPVGDSRLDLTTPEQVNSAKGLRHYQDVPETLRYWEYTIRPIVLRNFLDIRNMDSLKPKEQQQLPKGELEDMLGFSQCIQSFMVNFCRTANMAPIEDHWHYLHRWDPLDLTETPEAQLQFATLLLRRHLRSTKETFQALHVCSAALPSKNIVQLISERVFATLQDKRDKIKVADVDINDLLATDLETTKQEHLELLKKSLHVCIRQAINVLAPIMD